MRRGRGDAERRLINEKGLEDKSSPLLCDVGSGYLPGIVSSMPLT